VTHAVTLIPGDGTGPELTEATRRVLEATGVDFEWDIQPAGADVMHEHGGDPLPEATLDSIRRNGVALKGPITTPIGEGFRSVNVALRNRLDLYAQVRPCKTYPGVRTLYKDIDLVSRYHSDPWWGRGEAISLTAIPRDPNFPIGTLHNIHFDNIRAKSENSARISGSTKSRPHHITLNNVALTLDRWTKYKGGIFDNRPARGRYLLVHQIEEMARHAGHADIIREQIDGQTGR